MYCTPGGLGLFSTPATETLQADSQAVIYCSEDERLTFVVWVVVVKKSDSPRQSPNTNGCTVESSSCGHECSRTANFYAGLCCC